MKYEELNEKLADIRATKNEFDRAVLLSNFAQNLSKLARNLDGELKTQMLQEALAIAREIKDDFKRARILFELARNLEDELKTLILQEALAIAHEFKDDFKRVIILSELAQNLDYELKTQILQEALAIAREIKNDSERAIMLSELARNLDDELKTLILQEALAIAREIKDDSVRASILSELAQNLDGELKTQVLQEAIFAAREIKDDSKRAHILSYLARNLYGELLQEALFAAREIKDDSVRASILSELAQNLDGELKTQVLQEALVAAHEIIDDYERAHNLSGLAQSLDGELKTLIFQYALAAASKIKDQRRFAKSLRINEAVSDTSADKVLFTAYHPKEGNVEMWHTLLVYTHTLSTLPKIQEDANRFKDQIKAPKETTTGSSASIIRGTELTIIPSCEGITFNPERVTLKWMEDFHRADFRFKADKSLLGDAAKGSIDIYVGPLIIGTLKFAMLFKEKDDDQSIPVLGKHAKMYGKNDVFISYSRKDSEVARAFKNILEGTGLDVFLDVDDLRSGQLWEDELKRRIKRAKIFQIFWSANYSQSENCKQEWEYALKQNKDEGYIRPVFWQKPLTPNPPEELNKFNFKYVELKL